MPIRRAFLAALAVTAALGIGAPAAGASTLPVFTIPTGPGQAVGPCGHATNGVGVGNVGQTEAQVCLGSGLAFVAPAIGQIASVIGPTIIGPAVVGTTIVSAGNAVAVP
jgi:hypothetical protein